MSTTATVRPAAMAGRFYAAGAAALAAEVAGFRAAPLGLDCPKALVLPHAGYRFSGAVAAAGMAAVPGGAPVTRVVLLGPSHHVALVGMAVPSASAFATPLGDVPVDRAAVDRLAREPDVAVNDAAHAPEHALEVLLPFLQARLGRFQLVPVLVGRMAPGRVADLLGTLWGGPETLIAVSTDLSHFLAAEAAEALDGATARKVELLEAALEPREACGAFALAGFLEAARRRGMRLTRLALTHSGAVTGERARVVGYGAWMAQEAGAARLPEAVRGAALRLARQVLASRLARGRAPALALGTFAAPLQGMGASFVTLSAAGRLRGCIGSLAAHRALAEDIAANTVRAGFEDPRFRPLAAGEVAGLDLEIAVLGPREPLSFASEAELIAQLRPGEDGLILEDGARRGTFLPKVWEALPDPAAFLAALKVKAGLPRDHWSAGLRVWRYGTERFGGPAA